jgi:hypothetical protein
MEEPTLTLLDQLLDEQRRWLTESFASRHMVLEDCSHALRQATAHCRANGFRAHEPICNACLFLNMIAHDLSVLVFDLAYERDEWRRRFIARSLALVLYEVADDLPAVFGKQFRDALRILAVPQDLVDNLNQQMARVSDYWNRNREMLSGIRTVSAAHREHDALKLHETIDSLDLLELLSLGLDFALVVNDVGPAAEAVFTFSVGVTPPELGGCSA